jgi:hypothetical protein
MGVTDFMKVREGSYKRAWWGQVEVESSLGFIARSCLNKYTNKETNKNN